MYGHGVNDHIEKRTFPMETVTRVGRCVRRPVVGRVVGAKAATDAKRRKKTLNGDIVVAVPCRAILFKRV